MGREAKLATLWAAMQRAAAGAGGSLVVAGEAGIGKSRLVREAVDVARAPGMTVLVGQAAPGSGATVLRALAEALLSAFRARTAGSAHALDPSVDPFSWLPARP
jgi:predicted ATPase